MPANQMRQVPSIKGDAIDKHTFLCQGMEVFEYLILSDDTNSN